MSPSQPIRLMITGKMGAGKSSASAYLEARHDATRWTRSESMKALAHALAFQAGDLESLLAATLTAEAARDRARHRLLSYAAGYVPEPGKPRRLYQDVAQILIDEEPLCFERELARRMRAAEGESSLVFSLVDDVRNREAFRFFSELGYRSLRIDASDAVCRRRMLARDGYLPDESAFAHPSERELDEEPHDFCIVNDDEAWTALHAALDRIVESLRATTHPLPAGA